MSGTICAPCERGEHASGHWSNDGGATEYCCDMASMHGAIPSECVCVVVSGEAGCSQCGASSIKAHEPDCIIVLKSELAAIRREVGAVDVRCGFRLERTHEPCGFLAAAHASEPEHALRETDENSVLYTVHGHPFQPEPTLAAVKRWGRELLEPIAEVLRPVASPRGASLFENTLCYAEEVVAALHSKWQQLEALREVVETPDVASVLPAVQRAMEERDTYETLLQEIFDETGHDPANGGFEILPTLMREAIEERITNAAIAKAAVTIDMNVPALSQKPSAASVRWIVDVIKQARGEGA